MIRKVFQWLISSFDKKTGWFIKLDHREACRLRVFCKYLFLVSPCFSYGRWAGGRRLFTRNQYKKYMDLFFKYGWVRWKRVGHPKSGITWTEEGREAFYKLAGFDWAPPLKSYDVGGLKGFEHTYIEENS